jgi:allantoin racemase
LKNPKERKLDATRRCRIWAQGATDQVGHRDYLAELLPHMQACMDPDSELEFKTMTPSVTTVHALSEYRVSRAVVRGAIAAER